MLEYFKNRPDPRVDFMIIMVGFNVEFMIIMVGFNVWGSGSPWCLWTVQNLMPITMKNEFGGLEIAFV